MNKILATVSLNSILAYGPCKAGLDAFKAKFGHLDPDTPIPLLDCLESNSVPDLIWALRAVHQDIAILVPLIAADLAESVLHIFEEKLPQDDQPRKAIEAVRSGDVEKARTAAAYIASAAYDAYVSDISAAYAAAAAAYAAHTYATYVVYTFDAPAAVAAATRTAVYAHSSANVAERSKQSEILRKYFTTQE